jgi:hypothetical protein
MRSASLVVLGLLAAVPAAAQAPVAPVAPAAPASPRALALADRIALAQIPPGAYGRMFDGMASSINQQMVNSMLQTPVRDLAMLGGLSEAQVAPLGEATLRQIVELVDPAFEARTAAVTQVTMEVMGELFTAMEPELRRVFAGVYARRYSEADLEAIAAFYATPAGTRFAATQLELMADPAVQQATADLMPRMLKALAGAGERVERATKHLPPPRTVRDMTPAEQAEALALLKGATPAGKTAS